jgi:chaperonin GroES
MAAPKLRPLADKVLVRPKSEEEQTAGGIVLPDTAKERPQEGEVVAVGEGKLLDNGQRAPMSVKAGDTVIYSKYGGTEVKLDGIDYLIMDESSIHAVRVK